MFRGTGNIFISYRRDDSRFAAGLIYERLKRQYSASRLFIDVDSITGGADFARLLDARLQKTRVLLAVIGDRWLDIRNKGGERRLHDPNDFVRMEISRALQLGITVIPVFLEQAEIPEADGLPADLKPLLERQIRRVRHDTFGSDMSLIVRDIKAALRPPPEVVWRQRRQIAAAAAAVSLLGSAVIWNAVWLGPLQSSLGLVRTTVSDWQQSLRDRVRLADDFAWESASTRGEVAGYESYLKLQPEGRYRTEAEQRIKSLRAQDEIDARLAEQRARAERERVARAEDERAWQTAGTAHEIVSYQAYLLQWPSGSFAAEARSRIAQMETEARKRAEAAWLAWERQGDKMAWEAADASGQTWAYLSYLQQRPEGAHAATARERIASLEAAAARAQEEERRQRDRRRSEADREEDVRAWNAAQSADEIVTYRAYLLQRPNGQYAKEATAKIAAFELATRQRTETLRKEQEQARAEAARQAEERAWSIAGEANQISQYQAYLMQWPEGRHAAAARRRVASFEEQAKRDAEMRNAAAAEMADRARPQPQPAVEPAKLALELQLELKRVGCDPGSVDGEWGSQSVAALKRFAAHTKVELESERPSLAAHQAVHSQKVRVCPLECALDQRPSGDRCITNSRPSSPVAVPSKRPVAKTRTNVAGSGSVPAKAGTSPGFTLCKDGNMSHCRVACANGFPRACARLYGGQGGGGGRQFGR